MNIIRQLEHHFFYRVEAEWLLRHVAGRVENRFVVYHFHLLFDTGKKLIAQCIVRNGQDSPTSLMRCIMALLPLAMETTSHFMGQELN